MSTTAQPPIPYLSELTGLWSIEPLAGQVLADQVSRLDLSSHLAQSRDTQKTQRRDSGNVAIIELNGPLSKHSSSFSRAGSTVLYRRDILKAARDPDIHAILVSIDSPGGTSAGTYEAAADTRKAAKIKPVVCSVTDVCASAAYWIASACTEISVNKPGRVGSIGTYLTTVDSSEAARQRGLKVLNISTGAYKGLGTPGTEISAAHQAYLQDLVDSTNAEFLAAIAHGRKLPIAKVRELADGRVFSSMFAKNAKLIDHVESFEQALIRASKLAKGE